ncbi:MAG: aspartate aminotransferase family protein, partial [Gemmatimonadetes bacterium]|nr:aspartate aminotransferase family protein [Gemmatimonadota bacterium]
MAAGDQIERRYRELHPKSAGLYERAKANFPDGVTHDVRRQKPFPVYITRGQGSHKWDVDGNEYVEYRTGHGALILGQSHPDIVAAVQEQMARGTHFSACTEIEIRWAAWIKELVPCAEKVRFHSSGTEAIMMAFRMARTWTGRTKVVTFVDHFHGWSDYAMASQSAGLGGIPAVTRDTMIVLPPGDVGLVERTLESDDDVAAVIVESHGAHMGEAPIHPEFLHGLRRVTAEHDVVFIMDEVVTGFRLSPGGAQGLFGVKPDLCALAKILGGGLPGGAVAGRADIIDAIARGEIVHPGTFNANPLSAAAGAKCLELVATTPVNARTDAAGSRLKQGLNDVFARLEIAGHAYGLPSIVHTRIGVQAEIDEYGIIQGKVKGAPMGAEADRLLGLAMMNEGVDSHRRFLMAMTHSDEDVDRTLEAFERSLSQV